MLSDDAVIATKSYVEHQLLGTNSSQKSLAYNESRQVGLLPQ
jgi:hypothetical protein